MSREGEVEREQLTLAAAGLAAVNHTGRKEFVIQFFLYFNVLLLTH